MFLSNDATGLLNVTTTWERSSDPVCRFEVNALSGKSADSSAAVTLGPGIVHGAGTCVSTVPPAVQMPPEAQAAFVVSANVTSLFPSGVMKKM